MMTYSEAYREGIQVLKDAGIEAPANDAGVLLCHAANCDRTFLYAHGNDMLEAGMELKYLDMLQKRSGRYPLQYLTGVQEFMSLTFEAGPGVLIPRQDTELLVETVLDFCRKSTRAGSKWTECNGGNMGACALEPNDVVIQNGDSGMPGLPQNILDMCTGSGCIAVSLAFHFPGCRVTACDIMPCALEIASRNAERNGVADRISFIESDLFKNIPLNKFDVIVSNPPYIRTGDLAGLQKEVRDHEPVEALDGGNDGLRFYRSIIDSSAEYLKIGGLLVFETGYDQAQEVAALMDEGGRYCNVRVYKDLAGTDRVVAGIRK